MGNFKYLIFYIDMEVTGTNDITVAKNFSMCEDYLVVDTETQDIFHVDLIGMECREKVQEVTGGTF